jgi:hypothetical protein
MVENQLGDNDTIYGTFNLAEVMSEFPPDPGSAARHRAEILVKTDTLRVVLVTMLSGGFMHDHAAPGPITIQVLKGVINLTVEGESRTLSAGELISLAPGSCMASRVSRTARSFLPSPISAGFPIRAAMRMCPRDSRSIDENARSDSTIGRSRFLDSQPYRPSLGRSAFS